MAEENPYQAPQAEVVDAASAGQVTEGGQQLATRGQRLGAAMIDALISMVIVLPIFWAIGMFDDFGTDPSFLDTVTGGAIGFVVMIVVQGYHLATRAQTLGKAALGIKIVTLDGKNADFQRIVLRRILPVSLVAMVPLVGNLLTMVDSLAIFRDDQRCVHDHIAGTRVVRV